MDQYRQFLKRIKRDLEAAIENTLYHATDIQSASTIVKEKRFRLTTALGTDSDNAHQNGKIYFLSTSRSRYNRYVKGKLEGAQTGAILNIDKDILQQNNSIKPIDYWSWSPDQKELEDRVFSNKPEIGFAGKPLIQSVHVMLDKNFKASDIAETQIQAINGLIKQCSKDRIKLFIYDNFKDFSVQNTAKAISIKGYLALIKTYTIQKRLFSGTGRPNSRKYFLGPVIELLNRPVSGGSKLSERAKKVRYQMVYDYYQDDVLRSLKADVHNAKTRDREIIVRLIAEMKRHKIKNLSGIIDFIKAKWKGPIE